MDDSVPQEGDKTPEQTETYAPRGDSVSGNWFAKRTAVREGEAVRYCESLVAPSERYHLQCTGGKTQETSRSQTQTVMTANLELLRTFAHQNDTDCVIDAGQ